MPDSFDDAMFDIYRKADCELGIRFKNFLHMVVTHGGVGAAKRLLNNPLESGFTALWEHGRLDLTMEALVIQPKWASLFTEPELEEARKRLADHGWKA